MMLSALGFGVLLTCGVIKYIRPTDVIQIESKNKKLNFPSLLEPGYVASQKIGSFVSDNNFTLYNLHLLMSGAEQQFYVSNKIRYCNLLLTIKICAISKYIFNQITVKQN